MKYLEKFTFPDLENDNLYHDEPLGSFYDEHTYPFHITSSMGLWSLDFEPITILYGGNGSGKSTIINVISEKLQARRNSRFNSGPYFSEYVSRCYYKAGEDLPDDSLIESDGRKHRYDIKDMTTVLTSDDIFHWMLEARLTNDKKLNKSRALFREYCARPEVPRHINFETGYNVDRFQKATKFQKAYNRQQKGYSFNKYLLESIGKMERGFSNGETALMKLTELIEKPGLYLLDAPENSMSCEFHKNLADVILYLASYADCQFLISTHSPFILSMPGAKIYNLDHNPVDVCPWWELDNMKHYFTLFYSARDRFPSE